MPVVECPKPVTKQKSRPDVPGGLACCQAHGALMQKYKNLVGDALRCFSFPLTMFITYTCATIESRRKFVSVLRRAHAMLEKHTSW
jgi:hypothetical protein